MQQSSNPFRFFKLLNHRRDLILTLIKRDVVGRYKASSAGLLWSLFQPLAMLLIYTFVFGIVGTPKFEVRNDVKGAFSLVLFSGLLIFNVFAECMNRAPTLIVSNTSYVKKVIFPLEILPLVALVSTLFHFAVGFLIWIVFHIVILGLPAPSAFLLPLFLLPLSLLSLGVMWIISAVSVFVRDIGHVIGVVTTALMFLTPVFYSIDAVPEKYRILIRLNPVAWLVDRGRASLIFGKQPDLTELFCMTLVAALFASFGYFVFQSLRRGFADVL